MYSPPTAFHPSLLSYMVNSSVLPLPSGQLQFAMRAPVNEMANVYYVLFSRSFMTMPMCHASRTIMNKIANDAPTIISISSLDGEVSFDAKLISTET